MSYKKSLVQNHGKLGTFSGVFTPSILTILGIILFLRLGYIVGESGLFYTLIIIALANSISILTSFSLAAIATNLKVKGGGDYYLISRTLGLEYGGALGIVLFLAQSVSIAFYCIGFGEAVVGLTGEYESAYLVQLVAASAVVFLFFFSWSGADLATKFQFLVMTFLGLALVSFYAGAIINWNPENLMSSWKRPENALSFWITFAIFFPAVTGFTQGVSMSGDLKNPRESLPRGTFLAVGLSVVVYFSAAVLFAAARPLDILTRNFQAMREISFWVYLFDAGVIAATLSSAMASFLGAPRILQSLSQDKIFTFLLPFADGTAETQNPRRAVVLSAIIALCTIVIGELDLIARLVSMFFLISYGLLNYATYYEAKAASPSFRPSFRWYHPNVSLAGFLACLGVMLAIDLTTGITAIAIMFAIYQYLKRTARPVRWADSQRSHHLQNVRANLLLAGSEPDHPRDWRPYILAFSETHERRQQLLEFARWLEGGSGLTTVVQFLSGEGVQIRKMRKDTMAALSKEVKRIRNDVFSKVVSSKDADMALDLLVQSFGIGPIQANTILLNWIRAQEEGENRRMLRYGEYLLKAHRLGCHIVVLASTSQNWEKIENEERRLQYIDVWWRGDNPTSRLMLLLAYLTTRDDSWSDAEIRVLAVNYEKHNEENLLDLQNSITEARIQAKAILVEKGDREDIQQYLKSSALTFMPFDLRQNEPVDMFGGSIDSRMAETNLLALVMAGQEVDLDAEPEEGDAGILANALDHLENVTRRMEKAQKAATEAAEFAKRQVEEVEFAGGPWDEELLAKLKGSMEARDKADKAAKKYAREYAKFVDATNRVKELGP